MGRGSGGGGRKAGGGGGAAAAQDAPAERFGPSGAAVELGYGEDPAAVAAGVRDLLGPGATVQDIASAVGAPDDATVTLSLQGDGRLFVNIEGGGITTAAREIYRGPDGRPVVHNEFIEAAQPGAGVGTRVFARQVEQARRLGVAEIRTLAEGGGLNGYYTWPRLGYDAPIPASVAAKLPSGLAGSRQLSDLMATPEGRSFWKANGVSTRVRFDLSPGSTSGRVLDAYLGERGI